MSFYLFGFFKVWFKSENILVKWIESWFHLYTSKNKSRTMKVKTLHVHTLLPFLFMGCGFLEWVRESEASRERVCRPCFQTTTCMPFLGMKTTAHSRSHESNYSTQTMPFSYTFPFPAFLQSWHQLLLLEKTQLLLSLGASLMATRATNIKVLKDKCLKEANKTVIVFGLYTADTAVLMK